MILACFELWGVGPFRHKVCERSPLDDPSRAELQVKRLQLDVLFSDSSSSIGAPEHSFQWVSQDDLDGMTLEVVAHLARGHQERE